MKKKTNRFFPALKICSAAGKLEHEAYNTIQVGKYKMEFEVESKRSND
jgi:hypothetical protein